MHAHAIWSAEKIDTAFSSLIYSRQYINVARWFVSDVAIERQTTIVSAFHLYEQFIQTPERLHVYMHAYISQVDASSKKKIRVY